MQERTFERLGGTESLRIEARIVALTNVDLTAAVASGHFREDLYFRLNVLALTVPPLRERRTDILPLADHLLTGLRSIHGHPGSHLSEPARRMLATYAWPGNVRELRNALERAIVFSRSDTLEPGDFPDNIRAAASGAAGSIAGCGPSKRSSAKSSPPRSKRLTTASAAPPKPSASAAKPFLKSAKNTV